MYKENIELIKSLIENGNPEYGILSFTSDTLDSMKSSITQNRLQPQKRKIFDLAMSKIVQGLMDLDKIWDTEEAQKI